MDALKQTFTTGLFIVSPIANYTTSMEGNFTNERE